MKVEVLKTDTAISISISIVMTMTINAMGILLLIEFHVDTNYYMVLLNNCGKSK